MITSITSYAQSMRLAKTEKSQLNFTAQLNSDIAFQLVEQVRKAANAAGKEVSVAIVDVAGQTIVVSKGDGIGPHNTEVARRKAFT